MAIPSISASDFTGWLAISQNQYTSASLADYISIGIEKWLRMFVGDATYIGIRDDSPVPAKYTALLDGTEYYNADLDKTRIVTGLTELVRQCIYFDYVRNQRYSNTATGVQVSRNENSETGKSANAYVQAAQRIGDAYRKYNAEVVPFLLYYQSVTQSIISSAEIGGGVYDITVVETTYLEAGDEVEIDGIAYTVSTAPTATVFRISGADTGLDFSGSAAVWKPFEDAVFNCMPFNFF